MALLNKKLISVDSLHNYFKTEKIIPKQANKYLKNHNTAEIFEKTSLKKLLKRPQINVTDLSKLSKNIKNQLSSFSPEIQEQTEIIIKYASYIEKEKQQSKKQLSMEKLRLKPELDYRKINSLSSEGREKLTKFRPATLGQASRISGVSPADISILMVYIGR